MNETSISQWKDIQTEQALLGYDGLSNPQAISKQLLLRKRDKSSPSKVKTVIREVAQLKKNAVQQTSLSNSTVKMNIQNQDEQEEEEDGFT